MIFDTHAHYDDAAFDADRDTVLQKLHTEGRVAGIVNVGATIQGCRDTVALTQTYDFIYGAVGIHPEDIANASEDILSELAGYAGNDKIVAIGEIGLDYHYEQPPAAMQKEWFARQIALADTVGLPMIIHSRDAAKDTLDLLQAEHAERIGGVIHCYSYTKESARAFLDMGFYFGIGGVLTFKNAKKLKEALQYIPMESIVVETDCPYLAPEPFRGKRNQSDYIAYVLQVLASIKGISAAQAEQITYDNAMALYRMA